MRINKVLFSGFAVLAGLSFGVKNVSAAPVTVTDTLPETVTRGDIQYSFASGTNVETGKANYPFYNESTDGKYLLYCSDRNNSVYEANDVLTKDEKLDDGIAYILQNSMPTKKIVTDVTGYTQDTSATRTEITGDAPNNMANVWITQMAIWAYQGSITGDSINNVALYYRSSSELSSSTSETPKNLAQNGSDLYANTLWDKAKGLVSEANTYSNNTSSAKINMTQDVTWTKDGDVTKSSLIEVTGENGVTTFKMEISDAPDGTKVYKEDGTEITDFDNIAIGTKFYITVPTDKVSSGEASFKINSSSTGKFLAAYKYTDKTNNHQPSVLVGYENRPVYADLSLTISPDTASTISRVIYFLGFIILISGVGIIYANIKPRQQV